MTVKTEGNDHDSRPRPFQYSVRALFGLTTAVAIACAVFFALPAWVSILVTGIVVVSMPGVLTILALYGRGNTRAFGIAALFPASFCLLTCSSPSGRALLGQMIYDLFEPPEERVEFLIFLNLYFAVVLGNGLLGVWMRRWLESGRPLVVPPSPAGDREPQAADGEADPEPGGREQS